MFYTEFKIKEDFIANQLQNQVHGNLKFKCVVNHVITLVC